MSLPDEHAVADRQGQVARRGARGRLLDAPEDASAQVRWNSLNMPMTAWGVPSTLLGQKQRARYFPLLVAYFHTNVCPGLMMLVSSSGPSRNAGSWSLI